MDQETPNAPEGEEVTGGFDWSKWLPWIGGVVSLAAIIGAFFIGQSGEANKYKKGKAEYNKIYQAGQTAGNSSGQAYGLKVGEQQGKAAGEKMGQAEGYKAGNAHGYAVGSKDGYQKGEATGRSAGIQAGEAAGKAQGRAAGVAWGANAALGGYGNWNASIPYIVDINTALTPGVPFQVGARMLMQKGKAYYLCNTSTNGLCSMPYSG